MRSARLPFESGPCSTRRGQPDECFLPLELLLCSRNEMMRLEQFLLRLYPTNDEFAHDDSFGFTPVNRWVVSFDRFLNSGDDTRRSQSILAVTRRGLSLAASTKCLILSAANPCWTPKTEASRTRRENHPSSSCIVHRAVMDFDRHRVLLSPHQLALTSTRFMALLGTIHEFSITAVAPLRNSSMEK